MHPFFLHVLYFPFGLDLNLNNIYISQDEDAEDEDKADEKADSDAEDGKDSDDEKHVCNTPAFS